MEKKLEHEMEAGVLYRALSLLNWAIYSLRVLL